MQVRPTSDRLRETLFNVLAPRIEGTRFLDLCAGSGAVGIEALSRGAQHVTFVDRSRKMYSFIESNLALCGVPEDQAEVVISDVSAFLHSTARRGRWDIAFFDPPYAADYAPMLTLFGEGVALRRQGSVLVVEHYCENKLEDTVGLIRRWRTIRQGNSCLSFYERKH